MNHSHKLIRWASMFLVAWMLGVSNVMNEETRMVQDSFNQMEWMEELPDDEPNI